MLRRMFTALTVALAVMALLATPILAKPSKPDAGTNAALAQVRRATAQFHDVETAIAAGYLPTEHCVPQMGYHYTKSVAGQAPDGFPPFMSGPEAISATDPHILVYAPTDDGELRLVAVEYASWEPTSLFGQEFAPPGGPPFYTLHAWVWQGNPDGVFTPFNPNVSCS